MIMYRFRSALLQSSALRSVSVSWSSGARRGKNMVKYEWYGNQERERDV